MHRGAKTPHLKTTDSPSKEKPLYIPFLLIVSSSESCSTRPSDDPCNVQQICHTVCGLGSLPGMSIKAPEFPQLWKFMASKEDEATQPTGLLMAFNQHLTAAYCHYYKGCNKNCPPEWNSSISRNAKTQPIQSGWNTCPEFLCKSQTRNGVTIYRYMDQELLWRWVSLSNRVAWVCLLEERVYMRKITTSYIRVYTYT